MKDNKRVNFFVMNLKFFYYAFKIKLSYFFSRNDFRYCVSRYQKRFKKKYNFNLLEQNLSEKLQMYKCFYKDPLLTICADKVEVYDFIEKKGYASILVPILGIYENANDIDFERLKPPFIMKCSHSSGFNVAVKQELKRQEIKNLKLLLNQMLSCNKYLQGREWCYKDIKPRIIINAFLTDERKKEEAFIDYKFYCFGGRLEYFMVSIGELEHNIKNHKFDAEFKSVDYLFKKNPSLSEEVAKEYINNAPIADMIKIAEKLSSPFPHVRVDLYYVNGQIYFGELTFYSNSGYVDIYSDEENKRLGQLLKLDR